METGDFATMDAYLESMYKTRTAYLDGISYADTSGFVVADADPEYRGKVVDVRDRQYYIGHDERQGRPGSRDGHQ